MNNFTVVRIIGILLIVILIVMINNYFDTSIKYGEYTIGSILYPVRFKLLLIGVIGIVTWAWSDYLYQNNNGSISGGQEWIDAIFMLITPLVAIVAFLVLALSFVLIVSF